MSEYIEHGISIGINRVNDLFFIKLTINGTLKHKDYELMVPLIENAIKGVKEPQIKLLVNAVDFNGWEAQAIWDDLKFSLGHLELFTKIAFVGNKQWEEYAVKISNWFMIGDIEYFEEIEKALIWLDEEKIQQDVVQKELTSREDDIRDSLEDLFNRKIDLLEEKALKNPYLKKSIDTSKELIYG